MKHTVVSHICVPDLGAVIESLVDASKLLFRRNTINITGLVSWMKSIYVYARMSVRILQTINSDIKLSRDSENNNLRNLKGSDQCLRCYGSGGPFPASGRGGRSEGPASSIVCIPLKRCLFLWP